MPPSLGEAVLHLVGDDSKLISTTNAAKTKAQSILGGIGTGMRAVGRGILATATAVTAIGVAVGTTIGPASDLSETISKVNVVFGDSAEQVLKFGETSATALGMSKNAALSAAGTYGNLFRALGLTEDMSADMSTTLIGLAGDLASFNNMDPTVVLDSLRAGLTGETEPMKKLGININEMILKEKAMELGLYSGAGALAASAKAQASYALIMEQTSLAQGDFARTAGGVANQQRILAASIENIKASIGTGLLPILQKVLGGLSEYVSEFSTLISDSTMTLEEKVTKGGEIIERITSDISEALPGMMESGIGILKALVTGIISALPSLMSALVEVMMSILNFLIEMMPVLMEGAVQIVVTLAIGIAEALPKLIPAIVDMVLFLVNIIIDNLPLIIDAGLQIVVGLIDGIVAAIPSLVSLISTVIPKLVTTLLNMIPVIIEAAGEIVLGLLKGITGGLPNLNKGSISMVEQIIDAIIISLPKIIEVGVKVGNALLDGIWEALINGWSRLWEQFKTYIGTSGMSNEDFSAMLNSQMAVMAAPSMGRRYNAQGFMVGGSAMEMRLNSAGYQSSADSLSGLGQFGSASSAQQQSTVINNNTYNVSGNYKYQSEQTITDEVKMLQLMGGTD